MITDEMMPALQGNIPAAIVTCNKSGIPNTTFISQVFYVDPTHVAVSFQFFNKTKRNILENPKAMINVTSAANYHAWNIEAEFLRSESEGDIFDQMDMQLEAIASMTGMSGIFKLLAADIYEVKSVRRTM
jgi:flavin reductase (DIM6/NTAB) family NADH-FMN oxidoreductase RutF